MYFEWDERKSYLNNEKHGIDFRDVPEIFLSKRFSSEDNRRDYGEDRIITIGTMGKSVCVVVYTMRGDVMRIISARKANERERRRYYERLKEKET